MNAPHEASIDELLTLIGEAYQVVGILALGDLARQIVPGGKASARSDGLGPSSVAQTLGAISEPTRSGASARA